MLNLRRVKYDEWRKDALAVCGHYAVFRLIALWGFASIVGMLTTRSGCGGVGHRADRGQDSTSWMRTSSWTVAIAVLLIGGFGFEVWRRKFRGSGMTARTHR